MDKEIKKKTVLGYLPDTWHVKTIEQIAEVDKSSLSASTPKDYVFDYISLSDVDGEQQEIITTKQIFVSAPSRARRIIKKGDVLMSTVRPSLQGFLHVRTEVEDLIASTGFSVLSPLNNDGEYIYQYLFSKSISKQLYALIVGSNYPAINSSDVRGLKIAYPPAIERKLISEILSTWDKAINKTQQLITQLQQRNKGLMQELLTGKRRLKGFGGEWKKVKANIVFSGVSIKNNKEERLLSATQDKGIIPRDMLDGRVTMPTGNTNSFKLVEKGDFVISLRSFQGGIEYSEYRGLVSPAYTVLKPKEKITDSFYKHYFKSYDFIEHLAVAVIGIRDGKQIGFDEFGQIKIPKPSLEEQSAIGNMLDMAAKETLYYQERLEMYKSQKKGLMQKLLTGELRVNKVKI